MRGIYQMGFKEQFQQRMLALSGRSATSAELAGQEVSMKKIIIIVALVHLGFIGLILLMPGCRSTYSEVDTNSAGNYTSGIADSNYTPVPEEETASQLPDPVVRRTPPLNPVGPRVGTAARLSGGVDGVIADPKAAPQKSTSPVASTVPADGTTYTVVSGDTLWGLSRKFGVSQEALKKANNLGAEGAIMTGQKLKIPGGGTQASSASAAPAATGASTAGKIAQGEEYTVQSGDTLGEIATRAGVTVAELRTANGLNSDFIRVNQKLKIPVKGKATAPPKDETAAPVGTDSSATSGNEAPAQTDTPATAPDDAEEDMGAASGAGGQTGTVAPPDRGYVMGKDAQGRNRYVVGEGESLRFIAISNRISMSALRNANADLIRDRTEIEPGMVLTIPNPEEE
jgi:LysM repeat protein